MAKPENGTKKRGRPTKAEPAVPDLAPSGANGSAADQSSATLGFEAKLWQAADKLRNNMDAAEYKHVVLGLIFLKYISDAFEEKYASLEADKKSGADPEDPDEYRADNIFWVPKDARWSHLQGRAKQPTIGKLLDDAMVAIERDNQTLKGVLPKDYARPALDKQRLGELIDLIGTIGLGDKQNRSRDVLGRVYEYFLTRFASAEGKTSPPVIAGSPRQRFVDPIIRRQLRGIPGTVWIGHGLDRATGGRRGRADATRRRSDPDRAHAGARWISSCPWLIALRTPTSWSGRSESRIGRQEGRREGIIPRRSQPTSPRDDRLRAEHRGLRSARTFPCGC